MPANSTSVSRSMQDYSALGADHATYLESLYEQFLTDPASVDARWRAYFTDLRAGVANEVAHGPLRDELALRAKATRAISATPSATDDVLLAKQGAVSRLIQVYCNRGHLVANIDPLGLLERAEPEVLQPGYFGLTEADMEREFHIDPPLGATSLPKRMKLRDIIARLKDIYCGTIGAEFAHVSNAEERLWLNNRLQNGRLEQKFTTEERGNLLWQLTAAEGLERYLSTRYPAQKRFSLEGGDCLIPLMDDLIQQGGVRGVREVVIGMAHRGRLNVLVNVLGKSPQQLFSEFEGKYDIAHLQGSGDVKYHKGFSTDIRTPGGNVHVTLAFNPSHLEVVNPVVEGSVRARQHRCQDTAGDSIVPVLIHGDAAFSGQGVVMETLQMSRTRGYSTGGTVHVIVNNQVGFTTHDPRDMRSTLYCSDPAKMVEAPIFHVNGDDPEAVIFATRLALEYRMTFHKDVVVDLVCYRRLGHNEADEPAATQPLMYRKVRQKPTTRQIYAERLAAVDVLPMSQAVEMTQRYQREMDEGKSQARQSLGLIGNQHTVDWTRYRNANPDETPSTGVALDSLKALAGTVTAVPADFHLHRQVQRIVQDRQKMAQGELSLDWGMAETLAYASLLSQGYEVRISGQDSGRGTFFHRHAVWHDQETGNAYVPLGQVRPGKHFTVIDSLLSEEAVVGFEYGYATTDPNCLTIWEGQFGDFANGAQVIIDQFISSGEAKWGRLCGLTLFLPHGYEGQGAEHSSARLERFLQLSAENNMQVCVPSTPAQMFHMLRRQMIRRQRLPLIVMTPKSLLRHPLSVSALEELTTGTFRNVIGEVDNQRATAVKRVVFCSGKAYFDLLESRRVSGITDVAIVRIEQLYPFPTHEYAAAVKSYPNAREIVWCQEEPQNQGAWYQIRHRLQEPLSGWDKLLYAGRAAAAAPATGIAKLHDLQQKELLDAALRSNTTEPGLRQTTRLTAS